MNTIKDIRFGDGDEVVIELAREDGSHHATISTTLAHLREAETNREPKDRYATKHGVDILPAVEAAHRARVN